MRVAVSASGPTLDSPVDPRFGRCEWFVVVDPATMEFEAVENASVAAAQGAGIATAQMIAGKGAEAVLTGNCGPNAYQTLTAGGIKVVTGMSGTVREAVEAYRAGGLQPNAAPNVASHHGMGLASGRGMGGGAMRAAPPVPAANTQAGGMADLLVELKNQIEALRQQVDNINRRIEELHGDDQAGRTSPGTR